MSVSQANPQKILWAVDAFPGSPDVQAQAGRSVRTLLEKMNATVQPVYVARPAPPGIFVKADPAMDQGFMEGATKNLKWLTELVNLPNVTPPHFLISSTPTVGSQVKTLIEYAQKESFDLIVVGTHARKGVPRLFLGSFAEKLILESPLPVLVTNTKAQLQIGNKLKTILFPTDFSQSSREVFELVIAMAKNLRVDIVLFHHEDFIEPRIGYPFVVPPVSSESLNERRAGWKKQGTEWVELARTKGVNARFKLAHGVSASAEIVKEAEELPSSIIAMASQSNTFESALLGSVTRQVIRSALCPVYVLHPRSRKRVEEPFFQITEDDLPGPRRALLS